jgi:hypothetical protein
MAMPAHDDELDAHALAAARLKAAEAENERLRQVIRAHEHALKIAARVLQPYLGR